MHKRWLLIIAFLTLHAAAAHGTVSPETYRSWRATAAKSLAARTDAESIATAAALSFLGTSGDPSANELALRASQKAPDDAAIAWLRLQLCANTPGCDIRDAATTLRWVDADNGAAWLPSLAIALKDKDDMDIDRFLNDMAQGERFDFYWNRIVVLMFDALKRDHGELPEHYIPSDVARLSEAMSVASAEAIPVFAPLISACRDLSAADRREICLKISKTLQRGDTIVAQMAGLGIEKRLLPPEGKEARALADRRRTLMWRRAAANRFEAPLLPWLKDARARARIAQMRAMAREEDVCIAVLRDHKIPIDPPEDHR